MNTRTKREHNPALYEAILSLRSVEECLQFFEDLCTMSELSAMEQRYQVRFQRHHQPGQSLAAVWCRRI